MADLQWEDVLRDRARFGDDVEITFADGTKGTVGQLRNVAMPKGDYSRETEKWGRREKELREGYDTTQRQLREALEQLQSRPAPAAAAAVAAPGEITDAELEADPAFGKVIRHIKSLEKQLAEQDKEIKIHRDTFTRDRTNTMKERYEAQLASITTRHNNRFNADGRGKGFDPEDFLSYVQKKQIPDLEEAYKAWSRDDEIAVAVREAEERGVERGKKEASIPKIPFGRRSAPARPEGLPASLQDLTDEQLANDPDMIEAMTRDLSAT